MLVHSPNITEKTYRKLSIRIGQDALAFCVFDSLSHRILQFGEVPLEHENHSIPLEELYGNVFRNHAVLQERYDDVHVLHDNNLATFVPTALFDEQFLGSYLQYNAKVFESDFFGYDEIPAFHMNCVYVPDVNSNNYFVDQYREFDYRHCHTVLVSKLLEHSKNVDEKKMFVHFHKGFFEIVVVQNQHLLLFNSFEYRAPEDFLYYLLFTAEQLNLNPEHFKLELLGDIDTYSPYYELAYQYIRNISLFDVSALMEHNDFSEQDNRRLYILFQS